MVNYISAKDNCVGVFWVRDARVFGAGLSRGRWTVILPVELANMVFAGLIRMVFLLRISSNIDVTGRHGGV